MRDPAGPWSDGSDRLGPKEASGLAVREALTQFRDKGFVARLERLATVPADRGDGEPCWVCYCAMTVRRIEQIGSGVIAVVAQVSGGSAAGPDIRIHVQSEDVNPDACQCPPYVLEVLTATACPLSNEWRRRASRLGRDCFGYRMKVETLPNGRRCISVVLSTSTHACEVARSQELDERSFQAAWDDFSLRYGMSEIEPLRCR